jgi:hypothetical protein
VSGSGLTKAKPGTLSPALSSSIAKATCAIAAREPALPRQRTQPDSRFFASDLTNEEKMTLLATQTPTLGAALGSPISKAAWHTKPTWFVVASNDRTISPK